MDSALGRIKLSGRLLGYSASPEVRASGSGVLWKQEGIVLVGRGEV